MYLFNQYRGVFQNIGTGCICLNLKNNPITGANAIVCHDRDRSKVSRSSGCICPGNRDARCLCYVVKPD